MKQSTIPILLLTIGLLMGGCKGKNTSGESIASDDEDVLHIINLENITDQKGEAMLSEVFSEIRYIPLETRDETILGGANLFAQLSSGNMVICDRKNVMMFDPDGRFIRKISQHGNGPADYMTIRRLIPNRQTGGVYLHDSRKMNEFDAEGNFVRSIDTEERCLISQVDEEGNIYLNQMNLSKNPEDTATVYSIFKYDKDGNELKRYVNLQPRIGGPDRVPTVIPVRPLYSYKGKVRFHEIGHDTVYTILPDRFEPHLVIDLGKMKMDVSPKSEGSMDAVFQRMSEKLHLLEMEEDATNVYLSLMWGFTNNFVRVIYNKKTNKAVFLENEGLTNDIDGGFPLFPLQITHDGTMVASENAETFKEKVLALDPEVGKKKYGAKFEKLYKLAQELDEEDNPVVMLLR